VPLPISPSAFLAALDEPFAIGSEQVSDGAHRNSPGSLTEIPQLSPVVALAV